METSGKVLETYSAETSEPFGKMGEKTTHKRRSVMALWQSNMCYFTKHFQPKLSKEEEHMLLRYARHTDEFGLLVIEWAMWRWDDFATYAVGKDSDHYPILPDVTFFYAFQALAFLMWLAQSSEEIDDACPTSTKELTEVLELYVLDPTAYPESAWEYRWFSVEKPLKYLGKLVKSPEGGWTIFGKTFFTYDALESQWLNCPEFRQRVMAVLAGGE